VWLLSVNQQVYFWNAHQLQGYAKYTGPVNTTICFRWRIFYLNRADDSHAVLNSDFCLWDWDLDRRQANFSLGG